MVSSFHPHSMGNKVERVTTKTGCTSCTKRTISFEVSGFHTELVCYKGISFFWTYLNSVVFLCSKCTIQIRIINFQPFLTSFVIFHAFTLTYLNFIVFFVFKMHHSKPHHLFWILSDFMCHFHAFTNYFGL